MIIASRKTFGKDEGQVREQAVKRNDAGNVLFLILIAVALFAALSYAVTQSTRSGGGDASSETNLVNSAQITQYPASVKTAITRMIISSSIDPTTLEFNPPADFADLSASDHGVFHPQGGGASYILAPDAVVEAAINANKTWVFNGENEILNIGTNGAPTVSSADIIAFLPGTKLAICQSIHSKLGLSTTIPDLSAAGIDFATDMVSVGGAGATIAAGGGIITHATLDGQPQGCFLGAANNYVYYHVLVER